MRLQKSPTGLLGAFELKTLGQNPSEFGEQVVPVVDVLDNYVAGDQRIERNQTTLANPATFTSSTHRVPNGKVWRLLGISFAGVLDVADAALTTTVDVRLSPDPLDSVVVLLQPVGPLLRGGSLTRACKAAFVMPRALFLPAGWGVIGTVQLDAAPAVSFVYDFAILIQEFTE